MRLAHKTSALILADSWDDFGTCQCTDPFCVSSSQTCCVPGDSNTFENMNSVFLGNGMDGYLGLQAGSSTAPSTMAVDQSFSVLRAENNSAGALFEQWVTWQIERACDAHICSSARMLAFSLAR